MQNANLKLFSYRGLLQLLSAGAALCCSILSHYAHCSRELVVLVRPVTFHRVLQGGTAVVGGGCWSVPVYGCIAPLALLRYFGDVGPRYSLGRALWCAVGNPSVAVM